MIRAAAIRFTLFALLSLALTFAIAARIADITFASTTEHVARFDDVNGLRTGDDVRVAGVPVGNVRDIGVEAGRAVVRFEVERDVILPEDTLATVRWVDLIGSNELVLVPGSSDRDLAPGDEVTATRSATDLSALTDAFGPLNATLDPARLNELLTAVSTTLGGREDDVSRLLVDLDTALATFTEREDTIDGLLADYTVLSETIATRDQQIATLVDHLVTLADTFDASDDVLAAAIADTGRMVGNLDRFLAAAAGDLGAVLDDLAQVTAALVPQLDTLERALVRLPVALEAALRATAAGDLIELDVTCFGFSPPPCPVGGS